MSNLALDSLDRILAHKFVGNHHSDQAAFNIIQAFTENLNHSPEDRLAAANHLQVEGMGMNPVSSLSEWTGKGTGQGKE